MKCLLVATVCLMLLFSATMADIGLGQQSSVGLGQQQPAVSSNLQGNIGTGDSRILRTRKGVMKGAALGALAGGTAAAIAG